MKIKYFLRGFGSGILIATLLLFLVYTYQTSDRQIEKRAKEMGMEYPNQKKNDALQENTEEISTEETSAEETSGLEETSAEEPSSETSDQTEVMMSITKGMSAAEFSEWMEELGIVDDGSDFHRYLTENDYTGSLQMGDYVFHSGMSYEDIAEMVIK